MEKLYLSGKIQAIGVCNFEKKHLRKLLKFCRVKPVIDQIERHPLFQQKETFDYCVENNIQVMSYAPLARNDASLLENNVLKSIASSYQKTVSQVVLRWNYQNNCIPIPASKTKEHITENFDIFDFELGQDDIKAINSLESGHRVRFDPDKRFSLRDKVHLAYYCVKNFRKLYLS